MYFKCVPSSSLCYVNRGTCDSYCPPRISVELNLAPPYYFTYTARVDESLTLQNTYLLRRPSGSIFSVLR